MIKIATRVVALLSVLAVVASAALADDDKDRGQVLYGQFCESCHGKYGEVSNEVIPNILGQYPGYMLSQLANFASPDPETARRGVAGDLKRSILLELTVQDFRDIVTYLDSIEYKVVGASEAEAKARGELAFQGWWLANYAGCGNCHGDDQMGLRVRDPQTGELDPTIYAPFTPEIDGAEWRLHRPAAAELSGREAGRRHGCHEAHHGAAVPHAEADPGDRRVRQGRLRRPAGRGL